MAQPINLTLIIERFEKIKKKIEIVESHDFQMNEKGGNQKAASPDIQVITAQLLDIVEKYQDDSRVAYIKQLEKRIEQLEIQNSELMSDVRGLRENQGRGFEAEKDVIRLIGHLDEIERRGVLTMVPSFVKTTQDSREVNGVREYRLLWANRLYEEKYLKPAGTNREKCSMKYDSDIWPPDVAKRFSDFDNRSVLNPRKLLVEPQEVLDHKVLAVKMFHPTPLGGTITGLIIAQ